MKRKIALLFVCVFVMSLAMTSCKNDKGADKETVNIKWYIPVDPGDEPLEAAKNYIKDKLNVNLDFVKIGFGDYDTKMQVLNAGNDEYDLVFTSSWCNNYNKNVANGTIIELDSLLKEYAPKTYALMEPEIWDLSRVGGKLYGVINQQIMGRGPCLILPEINLQQLAINKDDFKAYTDTENYFRMIKEKTGKYTYVSEIWVNWLSVFGFEEVVGQKIPGAIYLDSSKKDLKIVNQYESQEFKDYILWRRKMVTEGLTPPNIVKVDNKDVALKVGDNKIVNLLQFSTTYKPGIESELDPLPNNLGNMIPIALQTPYINAYSVTSTMTGVSATSKNPETAVKVLELVNNDKQLFNYFANGIENKDYKKIGENKAERLAESKFYCDFWAIGNTFNAYTTQKQPDDVWEKTKEINNNSIKSPLNGFVANIDNIKTQVYNCTATVDEFLKPLDSGVVNIDETYPKFIAKLKAAGVDDIISEINRQLEEWKKK